MSRIVNKLLSTTGGVAVETDEFFNQTTLLLHGDGTNGSQNNTFLDSSSNNFTITRNGSTTQGSYSPYGNRWSNYFDGVFDYLAIPNSLAFDFGSGDFTIEFWMNPTATDGVPLCQRDGNISAGSREWFFYYTSTGKMQFGIASDTSYLSQVGVTDVPVGSWSHIAAVKNGSNIELFINGVSEFNGTLGGANTGNSGINVTIGTLDANSFEYEGYISDLRIVKGTALYTSNFTPPTEPLTAVSGTSLLTCQSNRFKDNSSNDFAITVNGDTKVTPFSPYAPSAAYDPATGGGSGYFDGVGDYLTVPYDSAFLMGTSTDFCIEGWIYPTETPANSDSVYSSYPTGANGNWLVYFNSGRIGLYHFPDITTGAFISTTTIPVGSWTHFAFTRSGNVFRLFINGVQEDTYTGSVNFGRAGSNLMVGRYESNASSYFGGYISDLRHVIGSAIYTSAFTPPTEPLTAVTNTSLLCNFTNAGIFDSTGKNVLETVGNAQIDTAVTKFGTGSMEFDGNDYLLIPSSEELKLGGGDFTIEGWIYFNAGGDWAVFTQGSTSAITGIIFKGDNNRWVLQKPVANVFVISWTPTLSQWYHFACVRSGSTATMYIDGSSIGSGTLTNYTDGSDPAYVGRNIVGNEYLNGYIDDLRITKGIARYTTNFTPPTKAFPDQ